MSILASAPRWVSLMLGLLWTVSAASVWGLSLEVSVQYEEGTQQFLLNMEANECGYSEMRRGNLTQYVQIPELKSYAANHYWGNNFRIRGQFQPDTSYTITVDPGICDRSGSPETISTRTGDYPPGIEFLSKGLYFSKLNPELRFRHRQMSQVQWSIYRIDPQNRYLFSRTEDVDTAKMQSQGATATTRKDIRQTRYLADYPGERIQAMTHLEKSEDWAYSTLDLRPYYKSGDWFVVVHGETNKVIQFTDIGLYIRKNNDVIWGQTIALATGNPVQAEVALKQPNGETIAATQSDENGNFQFDWSKGAPAYSHRLQRIEAKVGDDSVEIFLKDGHISLSTLPASGVDQSEAPLQAYVYTDRGIYRLGETAHLTVLLRDWEVDPPSQMDPPIKDPTVELSLHGPQGKVTQTRLSRFNQQNGGVDWAWTVPNDAITGDYRAEVKYNGEVVGVGKFSVEQIIPPTIEGELALDQTHAEWSSEGEGLQALSGRITSRFLFGAPASEKKWEYRCVLQPGTLELKQWEGFTFHDSLKVFPPVTFRKVDDLKLDAEGQSTWDCAGETELSNEQVLTKLPGIGQINVVADVFEEGGRNIRIAESVPTYFHPVYPGVQPLFEGNLDYGKPGSFRIVVIDPRTGDAVPGVKVKVELFEKDYWGWYYFHDYSEKVVDSQLTRLLNKSEVITSKTEPVLYTITPPHCCDWELRVTIEGTENSTRVAFRNGWWSENSGLGSALSQKVNFTPDKGRYEVGETAHVLVSAPFDGDLYLVEEQNGQPIARQRVKVQNRKAELEIPITTEHGTWFRLNAILLRTVPSADTGFKAKRETPYRALGMLPIRVENSKEIVKFEITHPEEARPESKLPMTIQALDAQDNPLREEVWMTVSVVDEGILSLIRFQTPDPYPHFHRRPAYPNQWYDTMGQVIPYSLHRGESAFGAGDRLDPGTVKRVKPMVWWSGVVKTDTQGKLSIDVPIIDYTGRVRVMVVGWKNRRTGSAESAVPVKASVDLITSLPRVFGAYDSSQAVAEVFNNTDTEATIEVALNVEGPLEIVGDAVQKVRIASNRSQALRWNLNGIGIPGKATVVYTASNQLGDVRKRSTELFVRPMGVPTAISQTFLLKPGESIEHLLPAGTEFARGTGEWEVTLSNSPVIKLGDHLQRLVSYPYGCAEQTTSRLLAMMMLKPTLGESVLAEYLGEAKAGKIDHFIKEGIQKLEKMQRADGGFAYWLGGSHQYPWINAYATHFLWKAKQLNYDVPDKLYAQALSKLQQQAHESSSLDTAAYSSFVLGLNGQLKKSNLQRLATTLQERKTSNTGYAARLGVASLFTQAAAIRVGSPMPVSITNSLPEFDSSLSPEDWWEAHDFLSRHGGTAAKLYNEAILGNKDAVPAALLYLDELAERRYASTHTIAWTLLAMNELFPSEGDNSQLLVTAPDGTQSQLTTELAHNRAKGWLPESDWSALQVRNPSNSNIFGFTTYKGWPLKPPTKGHQNKIQVKRHYLSEEGQLLRPPFSVQQGTRLFAVITARHTISSVDKLSNVAVEDWLPAGFEIENQRLSGGDALPTLSSDVLGIKAWEVDYVDYGDDRVAVFGTLRSQFQVFAYPIRAVSQGTFKLMPVQAEAMYIPEFNAMYVQPSEVSVTSSN